MTTVSLVWGLTPFLSARVFTLKVPKPAILSADKEELGHSFPEADISDLELILALFSERAASSAKDEGERIRRVSDPIREKHGALKAGHSDKIKVALTLLCTSVAFAFFLLA